MNQIENPFLRNNPFRIPQKFYTENSYSVHSESNYLQIHQKYRNPFLNGDAINIKKSSTLQRQNKNCSNPFYRKNLIQCNNNNNNQQGDIENFFVGGKPQFLKSKKKFDKEEMQAANLNINSLTKISQPRNIGSNLNMNSKVELNSMKNLSNTPSRHHTSIKENYQSIKNPYKSLLDQNLITSYKKNPLQEHQFSQRGSRSSNTSRTCSAKNLHLALRNDGHPNQTKIRGKEYYRNMIHCTN